MTNNLVVLVSAVIGALGTVLSAYVAGIALQARNTVRRTEEIVNGRTDELHARVALLEELLAFARTQDAEPERHEDEPRRYPPA